MTIFDLLFLVSLLFVLVCLVAIAVSAFRSPAALRRWSAVLAIYVVIYALALTSIALLTPRRVYSPGEQRCWDDWCTTAVRANSANNAAASCPSAEGFRVWVVELNVSSVAKRVRQRAPDARAELEDGRGVRYSPCTSSLASGSGAAHMLSDALNPGESFPVLLPFLLPASQSPAGVVMHHGDFPGNLIIAADNSVLHPPALQQVAVSR